MHTFSLAPPTGGSSVQVLHTPIALANLCRICKKTNYWAFLPGKVLFKTFSTDVF
jgi:hypothetical protein